jgi:transcriptional regulator with XRE-family HTH domain
MGTVASLIVRAMKRHALTKTGVAKALGVAYSRLYEWETGARPIPNPRLITLATLAGIDPGKAVASYVMERNSS